MSEFSTFEEAARAAGFAIPHPGLLLGWELGSIRVEAATFGVGNPEEAQKLRFVKLVYDSRPPGRSFYVSVYQSDGSLHAMQGDGTAVEHSIGDRKVLLYTSPGRSPMFTASWLDEQLHVSLNGRLHPPGSLAFSPKTAFDSLEAFNAYAATLPALDIDDVLKIVESIR